MNQIILLLFSLTFIFQVVYSKKLHGYLLNPVFIFNIIFFLHNWSFSLIKHFVGELYWNAPYYVSYQFQSDVLILNLAGLWSFFLAYIVFYKRIKLDQYVVLHNYKVYEKFYYVFTILYIIYGFASGSFTGIYGANQASTALEAFSPIATVLSARTVFGVVALAKGKNNKKQVGFILILEILISIISGDRKSFVVIVITVLLVNFEFVKLQFRKIALGIIMILSLLYFSIFITTFRSLSSTSLQFKEKVLNTIQEINEWGLLAAFKALNAANSEGVQNWTYELVQEGQLNLLFGMSYVQSLVNTVILRPFQGTLVNYQAAFYFKSVAYPDLSNQGFDYTFSAESILNWGNFSFISYAVLGMIIVKFRNNRYKNDFYEVLYLLTMSTLFINLRTDSTAFFRQLSFFIITFFLLRIVGLIKRRKGIIIRKH